MSRRFRYADVAATVALVLSMSGGALAASHYLINSTRQINPKVLKKLTGKTGATGPTGIAGTSGQPGSQGPTGPKGEPGPEGKTSAAGLTDVYAGPVALEENIVEQIVADIKSVPPGSYILNARLTLEDNDELESSGATVSCYLRAEGADDKASAHLAKYPEPGNVETLSFTLGHTFTSTSSATLSCNDFNHGHSLIDVMEAGISAVQVQTLTQTSVQ